MVAVAAKGPTGNLFSNQFQLDYYPSFALSARFSLGR